MNEPLTFTAILKAMERARETNADLTLSHDAGKDTHKIAGLTDTLTVAWQDPTPQGDQAGWAWWLVTRDPETGGYSSHEESGGLDSGEELEELLANLT